MKKTLNILLSGYGKMGKTVEKEAVARGHQIIGRTDNAEERERLPENFPPHTVVIDFSFPEAAIDNIRFFVNRGLPVVTGTTGWYDRLDEIKEEVHNKGGALLFAPNFSIGVQITFQLNRYLSKMMAKMEDYHAMIVETHHIHKKDAPSGTAIQLAKDIIKNHPAYNRFENHPSGLKGVLPVISKREGEVPGTHEIIYNSSVDTVKIQHEAKSREGFARGAVLAAEFLDGKKGVYSIEDLLKWLGI